MSDAAPCISKETQIKRTESDARVSGSFGEQLPYPNPNIKRKVRVRIYGNVVKAVERNQYLISWDNGSTSILFSNSLRLEGEEEQTT